MHRIRVQARLGTFSDPASVARALGAVADVRATVVRGRGPRVAATLATDDLGDVTTFVDLIRQIDPDAEPTSVVVLRSLPDEASEHEGGLRP